MRVEEEKAVIWDMDGVIADTGPYHLKAWQETFSKRGIEFTENDFRHSFGMRNDAIIPVILGKEIMREEIDRISYEKEAVFRRLIGGDIKPLPGVIALMKSLAEAGFKMALASSTPRENIRLVTGSLGIEKYLESIAGAEDVQRGKPDPQVFLLAAEGLGVKLENCIVIEDAVAGVTAARRAGMRCLAVTTTHPRGSLREADLIVDSLEEVSVDDIERLLDD
jgi:beta-phosphoglucomutase family hydrolase